jgi:hypothetical protein
MRDFAPRGERGPEEHEDGVLRLDALGPGLRSGGVASRYRDAGLVGPSEVCGSHNEGKSSGWCDGEVSL